MFPIKVKRMFWIITITIVGFYTVLLGAFYLFQENLIYFPTKDIETTPKELGLDYEEIFFTTEDNVRLCGWWIPIKQARGTIIICHGNAGNISHRLEKIRIFTNLRLNCFIFDYRGYGKSQGFPTEDGTYKDVLAAWKVLFDKGISLQEMVIMGRSLGGPIAAYLASQKHPKVLILEATFTNLPELGQHHYPFFPIKLLASISYPTEKYILQANCPILIVHSQNDNLVPFSFGKKLFEVAPKPKYFLAIRGDHNYGFTDCEEEYVNKLEELFKEHLDKK